MSVYVPCVSSSYCGILTCAHALSLCVGQMCVLVLFCVQYICMHCTHHMFTRAHPCMHPTYGLHVLHTCTRARALARCLQNHTCTKHIYACVNLNHVCTCTHAPNARVFKVRAYTESGHARNALMYARISSACTGIYSGMHLVHACVERGHAHMYRYKHMNSPTVCMYCIEAGWHFVCECMRARTHA